MVQSQALADETAVMRRFDGAIGAAAGLSPKAYARVLRYVAERVSDELGSMRVQENTVEVAASDGGGGGGGRGRL